MWLFRWILGSFDTTFKGASAKKLTAFIFVILIIWLHCKYCELSNCIEFLLTDAGMVLALLGVSTWDKLRTNKIEKDAITEN